MIEGLKPYDRYKSAKMAFLGQLPDHWNESRAKVLFREIDERSRAGSEELLSVSHKTGVTPRSQKNVTMFKAQSYAGHKLCRPADVVINTMWAWMGALGVSEHTGIISPAYGVYRPTTPGKYHPRFIEALLRSPSYVSEYTCRSTGVQSSRLRLYPDSFLRIPLALPPVDEQAAIVKFIDYADRRIRRYIAAKQKLIKLLEEQKQAIIHQAVTRGLDPDVRLKPSGVEWLGDVPEHWEVVRFGRMIELTTGFPFKSDGFTSGVSDIRLIRGINVTPGAIRWESMVRWPVAERKAFDSYELRVGDTVLGMDRPLVASGLRVAEITDFDCPALLVQRVARLRPRKYLHARYLRMLLRGRGFAQYLEPIFTGISVPHISPEQIRNFRVPLPPIHEQGEIVRAIARAASELDLLASRAQREISLLREYRTRLISDVVTGKFDVRQAAANLPDESDLDVSEIEEQDEEPLSDEESAA